VRRRLSREGQSLICSTSMSESSSERTGQGPGTACCKSWRGRSNSDKMIGLDGQSGVFFHALSAGQWILGLGGEDDIGVA
jgi:hypothetical protein